MNLFDSIFAITISLIFSGALLMSLSAIFSRLVEEDNKITAAIISTTMLVSIGIFLSWERW
jgi:uncharacterized membrane protein YqjE